MIGYEYRYSPNDVENPQPVAKAILWINGVPEELPLAWAWDVNDRGQIVGHLPGGNIPVRLDPK